MFETILTPSSGSEKRFWMAAMFVAGAKSWNAHATRAGRVVPASREASLRTAAHKILQIHLIALAFETKKRTKRNERSHRFLSQSLSLWPSLLRRLLESAVSVAKCIKKVARRKYLANSAFRKAMELKIAFLRMKLPLRTMKKYESKSRAAEKAHLRHIPSDLAKWSVSRLGFENFWSNRGALMLL